MTSAEPAPSPVPADAHETRRRSLGPFLEQLAAGESGVASGLTVGSRRLELDPWVRDILSRSPGGEDGLGRRWPTLVAEGIAFRAKVLQVSEGSKQSDPVSDAALGVALLDELQRAINGLICGGQMGTAKPLTDFRNGLREELTTLHELLGKAGFAEATRRSEALTRTDEWLRPNPEAAPSRKPPEQFKKDPPRVHSLYRRSVERSRRPAVLVGVLAASVLVWGVMTFTRATVTAPPALTLESFSGVAGIRAVAARPPSLYIEVDGPTWTAMAGAQRIETLDVLGRTAAGAGYVGLLARTPDGAVVGQWLLKRGSSLASSRTGGT